MPPSPLRPPSQTPSPASSRVRDAAESSRCPRSNPAPPPFPPCSAAPRPAASLLPGTPPAAAAPPPPRDAPTRQAPPSVPDSPPSPQFSWTTPHSHSLLLARYSCRLCQNSVYRNTSLEAGNEN